MNFFVVITAKFHGTCKTFTCLVSSTFVFRLRIYFKITFHKIYQITCTLILMLHFKRIAIVKSLRKYNSMLFYRQQRKLKKKLITFLIIKHLLDSSAILFKIECVSNSTVSLIKLFVVPFNT